MKVYISPTGLHSRAMLRVTSALRERAPQTIEFASSPSDADFQLLHVISPVPDAEIPKGRFGVIQYCGSTMPEAYRTLWERADFVWSYYDLSAHIPKEKFICLPLGVDPALFSGPQSAGRSIGVVTMGYSTAPGQEAIQEVVQAVSALGQTMVHIGPPTLEGWVGEYPPCWQSQLGVTDGTLKMLYRNARFVACLRHDEGFEMPGFEGLVNGARPIVFDRADMRLWYGDSAVYVPECSGAQLVQHIMDVLDDFTPVTAEEIARVKTLCDWGNIAFHIWAHIQEGSIPATVPRKPVLLWVGDAVASTGFARSTHHICGALHASGFDVHVLGINYYGDPHDHPYKIYPCYPGGDSIGFGRLKGLVDILHPDVVVIQNDPWHIDDYVKLCPHVPVIGYIAIDGMNAKGTELNGLRHAAFWTEFARQEAVLGGYLGTSDVIPLGVDTQVYCQTSQHNARRASNIGPTLSKMGYDHPFIVGVVGRNQWRKRLDLTFQYFSEWIHAKSIKDAFLWVHSAPTGDDAWDLAELAKLFDIQRNVIVQVIPRTIYGVEEASLALMYNAIDVLFTTTLGEGMGLPMLEAAACGTPSIMPAWSALKELYAEGAGKLVPCTSIAVHPSQTCTVGGVMDRNGAIQALQSAYEGGQEWRNLSEAAWLRAHEARFDWATVGDSFVAMVNRLLKR